MADEQLLLEVYRAVGRLEEGLASVKENQREANQLMLAHAKQDEVYHDGQDKRLKVLETAHIKAVAILLFIGGVITLFWNVAIDGIKSILPHSS